MWHYNRRYLIFPSTGDVLFLKKKLTTPGKYKTEMKIFKNTLMQKIKKVFIIYIKKIT